jgi:hypothetical protein
MQVQPILNPHENRESRLCRVGRMGCPDRCCGQDYHNDNDPSHSSKRRHRTHLEESRFEIGVPLLTAPEGVCMRPNGLRSIGSQWDDRRRHSANEELGGGGSAHLQIFL